MIDFIKQNLLGSKKEFQTRFANPIKQGQTADASDDDVLHMRRRAHVLYAKLKGVIDRRDFNVLSEALLPKKEYVITLRLTDKQVKLYKAFLNNECSGGADRRL